ncbi:hypothetical protein GA0070562_1552 [Micromonospora tulbaghiae]|uniref:Uncharacterized protein n=1 Tax=Micromonospora tulbaghiae TaxID=479978 RepID=A0ABY0KKY0_9ACTN|nr:hypothetical protein GA0070562_1552 [Micromonospora tulbaghiae]
MRTTQWWAPLAQAPIKSRRLTGDMQLPGSPSRPTNRDEDSNVGLPVSQTSPATHLTILTVCRRPTHRGAGQGQGDKVERPAGRTTLSPWPWSARLAWVGGWWDGIPPATHPPKPFGNSILESSGPRRRHSSNPAPSLTSHPLPPPPPLPLLGLQRPTAVVRQLRPPVVAAGLRGSLERRNRVRVCPPGLGRSSGLVTGSPHRPRGDARGGAWGSGRLTFPPRRRAPGRRLRRSRLPRPGPRRAERLDPDEIVSAVSPAHPQSGSPAPGRPTGHDGHKFARTCTPHHAGRSTDHTRHPPRSLRSSHRHGCAVPARICPSSHHTARTCSITVARSAAWCSIALGPRSPASKAPGRRRSSRLGSPATAAAARHNARQPAPATAPAPHQR